MPPIASVRRELYYAHSPENGGAPVHARYIGAGLRREERVSFERHDDWRVDYQARASDDNGRSWSEWAPITGEFPSTDGFSMEEMPFACCYDPVSGRSLQMLFQRIAVGKGMEAIERFWETGEQTFFDHNFWQVSADDERSWGEPRLLRYEAGPDFDPERRGDAVFLRRNLMYGSYSVVPTRQGTVVYPAAEVPMEITDRGQKEKVRGMLCFIGRWGPQEQTYDWGISEPIRVPLRVSGRGLEEPTIAELRDGRLLLVIRGSTHMMPGDWKGKVENGGHKWMSLSADGGRTWSPVTDLRYDTGEPFYSPGAYAMLLRHQQSGRLLCFLNISPSPTSGDRPRYPLYLAEVDESVPAIKKETLTVVEDRHPTDTPDIQFSNFSLLEDRETGDVELYMTRFGEREDWRMADSYRYTIRLL